MFLRRASAAVVYTVVAYRLLAMCAYRVRVMCSHVRIKFDQYLAANKTKDGKHPEGLRKIYKLLEDARQCRAK